MRNVSVEELEKQSIELRKKVITMIHKAKSGHPGGSLSAADFVTALYFREMDIDPKNPKWEDRDRFVLSKGHVCPVQYAALATLGFFDESVLDTLRQEGSILQGHPDMKHTPGVDMTTGSLGQGISAACGMALASQMDHAPWRVYAILGDGELEEGQVWEAAMYAAHYKLDHLTAFVDNNGLQIDGPVSEVMSPLPIGEKFKAFGWHVISVNGHDMSALHDAIEEAHSVSGQPTVIVMKTVKGKGVKETENQVGWHGKAPSPEQCVQFVKEVEEAE